MSVILQKSKWPGEETEGELHQPTPLSASRPSSPGPSSSPDPPDDRPEDDGPDAHSPAPCDGDPSGDGEEDDISPLQLLARSLDRLPASLRGTLRRGRDLAREQRAEAGGETLSTGLVDLDHLLDGGLPRGTLVELVGRGSSGRFSALLATLAATTVTGDLAALVDLGDGLDPGLARRAGIDLERLLWTRPRHVAEALMAAELLLTTGFPLVVLDLGSPPVPGGRGAEASWLRLARSARDRRAALLVSAPYRASGTAADLVVEARARRAAWSRRGAGPGSPLLLGVEMGLDLAKARGRTPGSRRPLALTVGEALDLGVSMPGTLEPGTLESGTLESGTLESDPPEPDIAVEGTRNGRGAARIDPVAAAGAG